jgi:hypothetical protein
MSVPWGGGARIEVLWVFLRVPPRYDNIRGAWTALVGSVVVGESIYPVAGVDYPSRLAELRSWFPTDADCVDYLYWLRWPGGFVCPGCGAGQGWRGRDGRCRCRGCGRRVSVTAGTVFQVTRTPLSVWFDVVVRREVLGVRLEVGDLRLGLVVARF